MSAVWLVVCAAASAASVTHTVNFTGPQQTLQAIATGGATVTSNVSGVLFGNPFVLTPNPQVDVGVPNPSPFVRNFNPTSLMPGTTQVDVNNATGQVLDVRDLDVNAFNGGIFDLETAPLNLEILIGGLVPGTVNVVYQRHYSLGYFTQTGPAVISGNTFQIPGNLATPIHEKALLLGGSLTAFDYSYNVNTSLVFQGTFTLVPVPGPSPQDAILKLDGVVTTSLDLTGLLTFAEELAPGLGATGSVDLQGALNLQANLHLETLLVDAIIPEPGSLVLLGIGLLQRYGPLRGGCGEELRRASLPLALTR